MICVIDYGAGNLPSVVNALKTIGVEAVVSEDPRDVHRAGGVILPGVGAFGDGMRTLRELGMVDALRKRVVEEGVPYLGICLGLQFLGRRSSEYGDHEGLGWIEGDVVPIQPTDPSLRVPHMGWNEIRIEQDDPLLNGDSSPGVFYFVHSYHLSVDESDRQWVTATVEHGGALTAAVRKDNIFGVQFHPEKSQKAGLDLLRNFVELVGG
ncbi:imidazole glycerol phosphate synthase subunit HisH [bacterium]|nr:imidazole glycerol phosphate synthase subunit HisH [bacterium]